MSSKDWFVFDDFLDFVEGQRHWPERSEGTPPFGSDGPIEKLETIAIGGRLQAGDGASVAAIAQGVSPSDFGDVELGETAGDLSPNRVWLGHKDCYTR